MEQENYFFMDKKKFKNTNIRSFTWICDELLEQIFKFILEPSDRASISEVNKQWYRIEGLTRKKLVIRFTYALEPWVMAQRFRSIECLAIKGKPRICDWGILSNHWGGSGDPWVHQIVSSYSSLKMIHFRRLEFRDESLASLASKFGSSLEVFKLNKCSGFSTSGLLAIVQSCRKLRVLCLEESIISDSGDEWLHVLAKETSLLEVLNFSLTGLEVWGFEELVSIVRNCKSLHTLKVGEIRASNEAIAGAKTALEPATSLRELVLLYSSLENPVVEEHLNFPRNLKALGGEIGLPLNEGLGEGLQKLDLMLSTFKDTNSHLEVIKSCTNLEELKVRNIIGDEGIDTIAGFCKKLKKIRIENLEDDHSFVSQKGLISLASSCINLTSVAIYTSDLNNSALSAFGTCCPNLYNFRVAVLDSPAPLSELPLDEGVRGLLQGCRRLTKLALYLKPGGLSDEGLVDLGRLGENLKWLLLGCAGYSDAGFIRLANGCENLVKLEMRHCPFSEAGIAAGIWSMKSLVFVWCQGHLPVDPRYLQFLGAAWTVEFMPSEERAKNQFVAYKSLCEPRCDHPPEVLVFPSHSLA